MPPAFLSSGSSAESARKYLLGICLVVVVVIAAVFWGFHWRSEDLFQRQLVNNSRSFFSEILITREWLSEHQGVYVRMTPDMEVNPYLASVPGLKVVIHDEEGEPYVLKNPSLVTREISIIAERKGVFNFRITSLQPINPQNVADAFEREALTAFAEGLMEYYQMDERKGRQVFRYMAPLVTDASCLQCHRHQGYTLGEIRGGISISLPTDPVFHQMRINQTYLFGSAIGIIILVLLSVFLIARFFLRDLRSAEKQLVDLATTDSLTGLLNRRECFHRIEFELERADRTGRPLCAIMLDIDHFKVINDEHGHQSGDEVLKHLADTLVKVGRSSDILCRYGGEEFLIVAPETSLEQARTLAERIREVVGDSMLAGPANAQLRMTISLGVSKYTPGETIDPLISRADRALYQAKNNGRNRVCVLDPVH